MSNSPFGNKGGTATKTKPAAKAETESGDGFDTAAADGGVNKGKAGDPFSLPPTQAEVAMSDLVGSLLLCRPTEVIEEMMTSASKEPAKNVIRTDIIVLDGDLQGEVYEDVLIFQVALKRALLKVLNGDNPFLLGRVEMGTAKKGQNAPYLFGQPDDEDVQTARAYLAANK